MLPAPWRTVLATALVVALPPSPRADDAPQVNWSTLAYTEPAPTYRLRLGLEEVFGMTAAFVGYVIQDPQESYPGVHMPVYPWEKLTFRPGTWAFDADDFGTNMVGHPTAGTVYYLIARGNRVSIPEAFAWTFGTSLVWELIEFKEAVSINDVIMTPVGGLALGEAFSQLSAWFDRGPDDGLSRAMAFLFSPAKKLHDWIDRTVPDRDPRARGWHEFTFSGGAGFLSQSATRLNYAVVQLDLGTRIFRAPGYGEPGHGRFAWDDGNASRIGLGGTFAGSQVVDFLFDTETALVGLYLRQLEGGTEGPEGWDLFLGGTVGYEYGLHRWDLSTGDANRIALVRLPGVSLRARWLSGPWTATLGLDAALTFGGVQPFAFRQPVWFPVGTALPPVLLAGDYYYALGFQGAPSVEVRLGDVAVGGALKVDLLTGLTQPNVVDVPGTMAHLDDQRWLASAWARWRFPEPGIGVGLACQWRSRSGSADAIHASEQERSIVASLGAVF